MRERETLTEHRSVFVSPAELWLRKQECWPSAVPSVHQSAGRMEGGQEEGDDQKKNRLEIEVDIRDVILMSL